MRRFADPPRGQTCVDASGEQKHPGSDVQPVRRSRRQKIAAKTRLSTTPHSDFTEWIGEQNAQRINARLTPGVLGRPTHQRTSDPGENPGRGASTHV
jgi:hypothetical protein